MLGMRIERHGLGPRIYFLKIRLHEWQLGAAILLALGTGALGGIVHDTLAAGLAAVAAVAGLVISYELEIAAGASVALCAVALSGLGLLKPKLGVP
jgi:hypothetical protein